MTAINQMTTPHPTPEERYEAACRRSESRFKGGGSAAYMLDVRNEIITAIREAEAAGEARDGQTRFCQMMICWNGVRNCCDGIRPEN
jgi:hypothetical protein